MQRMGSQSVQAPPPEEGRGPAQEQEAGPSVPRTASERAHLVMELRPRGPSVQWTADTIDNEHLGRKSSKKCCIYHAPRKFGSWSDSEIDTDSEGEYDPRSRKKKPAKKGHGHGHDHKHDGEGGCDHGHGHGGGSGGAEKAAG